MLQLLSALLKIRYCIAGYFRGGKFSQIELFPAFQGENNNKRDGKIHTFAQAYQGVVLVADIRFGNLQLKPNTN